MLCYLLKRVVFKPLWRLRKTQHHTIMLAREVVLNLPSVPYSDPPSIRDTLLLSRVEYLIGAFTF